jgi:hypothetical protein
MTVDNTVGYTNNIQMKYPSLTLRFDVNDKGGDYERNELDRWNATLGSILSLLHCDDC